MIRLALDAIHAAIQQIAGMTPIDVLRRPHPPVVEGATRPTRTGVSPASAPAGAGGHPNPMDWSTSELIAWAGMRIALDCRHSSFDAQVSRALFDRAAYFAALVGD